MPSKSTIPTELSKILVVGNIVEYQSIEVVKRTITDVRLANALKVDYENVLKVFNKQGEVLWKKKM